MGFRNTIKTYLGIFVILLSGSLTTKTAYAEEVSLGLYPPILSINTKTPQEIASEINIKNFGEKNLYIKIRFESFNGYSDSGRLLFEENKDTTSLLKYISITDKGKKIEGFELAGGQEKSLQFKLTFPDQTNNSDYYFSILFISEDPTLSEETISNNSLKTNIGLSLPVIVTVGKAETKGSINEFSTPLFLEKGPVPFLIRVENKGKNVFYPEGYILIENMFGQTVGKIDLLPVAVLRNSVRSIPDKASLNRNKPDQEDKALWDEKFILGPYKATLYIKFANDQSYIKRSIRFFSAPIEASIGLALAGILVIIVVTRINIQLHKRSSKA